MTKAVFKHAWPYAEDALNLPVANVDEAVSFYDKVMGFQVQSREDSPHKRVILGRDEIRIGLAENGGDPSQEGCFFDVDNVEAAFEELRERGLGRTDPKYSEEKYEDGSVYKVFFVIAPDGLCYCIGQRQK